MPAKRYELLQFGDGGRPGAGGILKGRGIIVRYTGGLVRITCGTAAENAALLGAMGDYLNKGGVA